MTELRAYKLKTNERHARSDNTVLTEGYLNPVSVFAERKSKRIIIQVELWKDRATYESGTALPVNTFPLEISGEGFDFFAVQSEGFVTRLEEYLALNNPVNLEKIDFPKWEREAVGTGITISVIAGLAILAGLSYVLHENLPNLLALLP